MQDPLPSPGGFDLIDRLLGLAPLPAPDAWFATRTVARCLHGRDVESASLAWAAFFPRWALPALALLFLGALGLQQAHRQHTLESNRQQRVQEAFEVMAAMGRADADVTTQDSSL